MPEPRIVEASTHRPRGEANRMGSSMAVRVSGTGAIIPPLWCPAFRVTVPCRVDP
jgi:hypothetical protein